MNEHQHPCAGKAKPVQPQLLGNILAQVLEALPVRDVEMGRDLAHFGPGLSFDTEVAQADQEVAHDVSPRAT
jgi:hypothetical protein